jgi:CheY-like chemotaxis protein
MNPFFPVILCVEDMAAHAHLFKHALKEVGTDVSFMHVTDGQAALDYLAQTNEFKEPELAPCPTLVLLDLNIPKIDGMEVLKKIRASASHSHIPVVIMSTSNYHKDIEAAYENNANCYLVKPQDFDDLVDMVKGIVNFWLVCSCSK